MEDLDINVQEYIGEPFKKEPGTPESEEGAESEEEAKSESEEGAGSEEEADMDAE